MRHSPTPNRLAVNRGAAYMNGRLFRGTSDAHVIAIDAADGHTLWDVMLDVAGRGVTVPMAPTAWNGLVFVGNAGGDLSGVIGHVYALDARDGHVVWSFDVVPSTGPARATWPTADRYPDLGRRVLDGVHARRANRRALCRGGKPGAGLRHRRARWREPVFEFAHRA